MPEPKFMKSMSYDWPGCQREAFLQRMEPYFTLIDRGNTMVEMVMKGCSKAGGMMTLLEHLGVDKDNTMAIGDSTNDLPMFSVAGHTVCLGGGMEELKAEAEYITDTVMNDGVEKALRHFGLL
jgi:hydroxymethylpyrimidine pyrophosphatase-like HAD family hydrolase